MSLLQRIPSTAIGVAVGTLVAVSACGLCRGTEWTSTTVELQPDAEFRKPPVISALAIHPDGALLAIAGDDHLIRIYDLSAGRMVRKFRAHNDWVRTLAFGPQGSVLASGGSDGTVVLWDVVQGQRLRQAGRLPHAVTAIAFDHDGNSLYSIGFGDQLRAFDVNTSDSLMSLNCPCLDMRAMAYSADRRAIAVGGRNGIIRLWGAEGGNMLQEFAAHRRRIRGLAFSPDGQFLASCAEDGKVRISILESRQEDFQLECPRAQLMSLTFCGGDQLACGGSDNLIHIWDVHRRAELGELPGHTGSVTCLASSGNVLVSAGYDTTVRIWKRNDNLAEEPHAPSPRVGARDNRFQLP